MKMSLKEIGIFISAALILSVISYIFSILKLGLWSNLIISLGFAAAILISLINPKKNILGVKAIVVYLLFSIFNAALGLFDYSMQNPIPLLYAYLLTAAEIALVIVILFGVYRFRKWSFYLAELYFLFYFLGLIYLQFILFNGPLYPYYISIGDITSLISSIGTGTLKIFFFLLTIIYLAKIKDLFTK